MSLDEAGQERHVAQVEDAGAGRRRQARSRGRDRPPRDHDLPSRVHRGAVEHAGGAQQERGGRLAGAGEAREREQDDERQPSRRSEAHSPEPPVTTPRCGRPRLRAPVWRNRRWQRRASSARRSEPGARPCTRAPAARAAGVQSPRSHGDPGRKDARGDPRLPPLRSPHPRPGRAPQPLARDARAAALGRHAPLHLDDLVGRRGAPPSPAVPLRREHLLSRAAARSPTRSTSSAARCSARPRSSPPATPSWRST